ncbi:MAG: LysR family transcriptional regulator [Ruminococcaceae bacterium]|nr:LysR family transcriptional regulator [Oscillospiraceae bacterium]
MIDFRHETFLALCEIKSYTKTAEHLHITQPAVSQHIKYLENLYGGKLFLYNGKELQLTDKGRKLYNFTKRIAVDCKKIKDDLVSHRNRVISFGATLTIGEYIMPDVISRIMKNNPDIHFNMYVENTSILLKKLENGDISFAVIEGFFDKSKYGYSLFRNEPFIGICSPSSVHSGTSCSIEGLLNNRLILREAGSGTRAIFENVLFERNLSPESFNGTLEIGSLNAIKKLVSYNAGISFMYNAAAREEIKRGNLSKIKLSDWNVTHEFNFVYTKDSIYEDEITDIIQMFKEND